MCLSGDRRQCPDVVLLQCFLWIRDTDLSLVISECFFCLFVCLFFFFVEKRHCPTVVIFFMEALRHVREEVYCGV